MDEKTLIDQVMTDHELIPGSELADAYWAELRAEILHDTQERSDELFTDNDWPWKKGFATVNITGGIGNGEGDLPAGFQAFGAQMTVTVQNVQRPPLMWRPLSELVAQRTSWAATVAYPRLFSIKDESNLGIKRLIVAPWTAGAVVLEIVYDKNPPILTDTVAPSGLEEWPVAYHRPVLKEMTIQERMRAKGDVRADTSQERKVQTAITNMVTAELPSRGAVQRMPPHPSARRFYGRW